MADPPLRAKALRVALDEHRGYLAHTRRNGPLFTGKAGRVAHELHEAKMALLVELLEAEQARLLPDASAPSDGESQ